MAKIDLRGLAAWFCVVAAVSGFFLVSGSSSPAKETYPKVQLLLASSETILGQAIAYPDTAKAKVTAAIVTLKSGEETGWHTHSIPLFGYVLEGELTVDYGKGGKRIYRKGDSLLEALKTEHNGRNSGDGLMRILAVFMGGEGIANSVPVKPAE